MAELCNLGTQRAARKDCTIFGGKVGFPQKMCNFLRKASQPAAGPRPGEQPMSGMDQVVIYRLPLCKKNNEACELDEARQAVVKVGRKALKRS